MLSKMRQKASSQTCLTFLRAKAATAILSVCHTGGSVKNGAS